MKSKKAQKAIFGILIAVILIAIVGGGLYYFFKLSSKGGVTDIESTSEDGFATLTATFYTDTGDAITPGITQALIGGTNQRTGVIFEMKASNTGNVDLTNVQVISPNANMNGAFDNIGALSSLNIGQSAISLGTSGQSCPGGNGDCDTNEYCSESAGIKCAIKLDDYASGTSQHNVDFTISLQGDFINAIGESQSITSDPVTLTYDILEETCTDTTTINTCVFARTGIDTDKPDYCNFIEGSAPSIIEKASVCGCPTGYHIEGETCELDTCSDGTPVGSCSTTTTDGTYGAYMYCKSDRTFEARCNECGCTNDAHGNSATGCNPASGEPSTCTFQTYTGGLSGTLTE